MASSLGCLQQGALLGRPSALRRERASRSLRVQSFWKGFQVPALPTLPTLPTLPKGSAAPKGGSSPARGGKGGSAFVSEIGSYSVQGTVRKRNEDRLAIEVAEDASEAGDLSTYAAVFDGHGGFATADWLSERFISFVAKYWDGGNAAEACMEEAFLQADKKILAPKGGFMGLGERGIGGSKCGSTAAVVLFYKDAAGKSMLLSSNVGDARTVLARAGAAVQLSEDHVPDSEAERKRIERQNPNPRLPLVRYVGDTWRVGGLLALSRAFGDAYMKGTGQFEGVTAGSDGYSSGFGVVAEPHTVITELTRDDQYVIVSSDGLYANDERGGGGGLSSEEVAAMAVRMGGGRASCDEIAAALAAAAVEGGSTDDVTVIVIRLK